MQLQFLIHLLPVSSGFHFYTHAFRSLHGVFYALPIVHNTSSKNAKLSSATTSFPWRHTNSSNNHGYNAVADDSCGTHNCCLLQLHFCDVTQRCRGWLLRNAWLLFATTSFSWCHTDSSKNNGYNAVADDLPRQPFRAEDSAFAPDEKGKKGRKCHTFSDHTYPTVSSRPRGEMCAKFGFDRFRNVNLYKVQTNKLPALYIR